MNEQYLKSLWQSQEIEPTSYSPEQLRRDAGQFRDLIVRRNHMEMVGTGLGLLFICALIWIFEQPMFKLGAGLMVAGGIVYLLQLQRRGGISDLPAESAPHAIYLRAQLVHQRDVLRGIWLWGIGPGVPGMCVLLWGLAQPNPADFPWALLSMLFVVPAGVVCVMNWMATRRLQRKIDQLDKLTA